jgi:hypothetical protein
MSHFPEHLNTSYPHNSLNSPLFIKNLNAYALAAKTLHPKLGIKLSIFSASILENHNM